jgi:two-component system, OmpR family, phosphate regulon sensor histidine kinase PhoR
MFDFLTQHAFELFVGIFCWLTYELLCATWITFTLTHSERPRVYAFGIVGWLTRRFNRRLSRTQAQNQRLRRLLGSVRTLGRSVPDAMLVLDADCRVIWHNRNAKTLLGLRKRAPNQPAQQLDWLSDPRFRIWLDQQDSSAMFRMVSPIDSNINLSFRVVNLPASERLLVARDVTLLMRLEQVRRDFVANVSHELRTPLTVLHGYLDTLEPDELPEYNAMFDEMRRQNTRMIRIVEDLLILARLENAQDLSANPQKNVVATVQLLHAVIQDAQALSQGKHQISLENSLDMDIIGDEKDLRSAFSNVLSNAVRYTPADGRIDVRWIWHSGGGQLVVQDSGIGIPSQHLGRLTERFYRVSSSRSRDSGGTGLGLAIVNHVLNAHQARLEISSEQGVGSCFRCIFPIDVLRYRGPKLG